MCRLRHQRARNVVVVESDEQRLGAGDRAEERQHEVGKDVAVAVERRDDHRRAARGDQKRERRVDQLRLVRNIGMTLRRSVHLLLEHALVHRADRVFRTAEDLGAHRLGLSERELGDGAADARARSARCEMPPRRRPCPHATPSRRTRRPPPCGRPRSANGHRRAGRHPEFVGPVRTITWPPISSRRIRFGEPTSSFPSGRHRRSLQAEPAVANRARRLVNDRVLRRAPALEREIEARQLELDPHHVGCEHPQRLLEQLLSGLVAFENDDRACVHGRILISRSHRLVRRVETGQITVRYEAQMFLQDFAM